MHEKMKSLIKKRQRNQMVTHKKMYNYTINLSTPSFLSYLPSFLPQFSEIVYKITKPCVDKTVKKLRLCPILLVEVQIGTTFLDGKLAVFTNTFNNASFGPAINLMKLSEL